VREVQRATPIYSVNGSIANSQTRRLVSYLLSQATADAKKRSPSDFLKSVLGRPVRVKLNSGIEYRGVLACLDGYMNIAMEQTEEYVDGQLKAKYGDCFIRGNNGMLSADCIRFCGCISGLTEYLGLCSSLHFNSKAQMTPYLVRPQQAYRTVRIVAIGPCPIFLFKSGR
jgi:U6 snRNA-associated Sm-like protein LSm6